MRHLTFITALVLGLWAAAAPAQDRAIEVTGLGEVSAVPDMAMMQVGVSIEAGAAEDAVRQLSERLTAVLERIEALGIGPADVQTSQMTLNPVWDRNQTQNTPRQVRGYLARSVVSVRVRDLLVLGRLLDVAVRDGATEFGGLRFALSDPGPAEAAARRAAVRDAALKAGQMAEAAGVTLGPLNRLSERGGGGDIVQMEMMAARSAADVPVAPGEITIRVEVAAVYGID